MTGPLPGISILVSDGQTPGTVLVIDGQAMRQAVVDLLDGQDPREVAEAIVAARGAVLTTQGET